MTWAAAFSLVVQVAALEIATDWRAVPLGAVERAAGRGDKVAALELGERHEGGFRGARCDAKLALRWYARAARTESSRRLVYSPAIGNEPGGRMVDAGVGRTIVGMPMAMRRYVALKQRQERAGEGRRAPRCLAPVPARVAE